MPGPSPWMGTITLPNANQAYQLLERIQSLPANKQPTGFDLSTGLQFLAIQANEAGGQETLYYIGNSPLTATYKGVTIWAAQVYPIYSMGSNIIRSADIYLMATAANETMNVSFIQR